MPFVIAVHSGGTIYGTAAGGLSLNNLITSLLSKSQAAHPWKID